MESTTDQFYRRAIPELWPRFALWTGSVFALNLIHSHLQPGLSPWLQTHGLAEMWYLTFTIFLITFTLVGLAGLVTCYYFSLRERRIHSALSEGGLAIRAVLAGLLAFAAFGIALFINDQGFGR